MMFRSFVKWHERGWTEIIKLHSHKQLFAFVGSNLLVGFITYQGVIKYLRTREEVK